MLCMIWLLAGCSLTSGNSLSAERYSPGELSLSQRARCRTVAQAYVDRAPEYPQLLGQLREDQVAIAWFVRYLEAEIVTVREARAELIGEETVAAGEVQRSTNDPAEWNLPGQPRDRRALGQIVAIGKPAVEVVVHDLVLSPQEFLRAIGIELLTGIGDAAVPALLELAQTEGGQQQRVSARALGRIGARGPALEALRQLAHSESWRIRSEAASGLTDGSDGARDLLLEMLRDEDAFVRRKAGEALASYRDSVSATALVNFLEACLASGDFKGELAAQNALQDLAKKKSMRSVAAWRRFVEEMASEEVGR